MFVQPLNNGFYILIVEKESKQYFITHENYMESIPKSTNKVLLSIVKMIHLHIVCDKYLSTHYVSDMGALQ